MVGNGAIAARRAATLVSGGADVIVCTPDPHDELYDEFTPIAGRFRRGDITADDVFAGCTLCYFAPDEDIAPDPALVARARDAGALVNVADHPNFSDFITPSVLDRSPLIVAISTGGEAPLLGRMLKARLETLIPASYGRLAAMAGKAARRSSTSWPTTPRACASGSASTRARPWKWCWPATRRARAAFWSTRSRRPCPTAPAPTRFYAARFISSAPGRAIRTCSPSAPSA